MSYAFATRAVHTGERTPLGGGYTPVVSPIHPSVGYTYPTTAELDAVLGNEQAGYVYSTRYANPTTAAFEQAMAELEGGEAAYAAPSGMAAIHLALLAGGVRAGSHVVAAGDIYGATYALLTQLLAELGAITHVVEVTDVAAVAAKVAAVRPAVLLVETISNPLLKVADVPALAEIAHQHGALLLVDNTFCTPYLCTPLAHGADMVIHSATKYIAGHGDVMAGVVVCSAELRQRMMDINKLIGSSLGPFEAWLALRGLKTLPLRLREQCANALVVAEWLAQHPRVAQVHYPWLAGYGQRPLWDALTTGKGGGGMISFVVRDGGRAEVFGLLERLRLFQSATTLGDIYSLVLYPVIASHRSLTAEERAAVGIGEGLVRLSIGIEDVADLIGDLAHALEG